MEPGNCVIHATDSFLSSTMLLDYLKTASLAVLPFTLYLALKKIGHKVAASYSWRAGTFIAPGIGTITLINMKDSPLAIFSIHAVMDTLSFNLKDFYPPLILKAMETVNVEAETVSNRYLGNDVFEWKDSLNRKHRIQIFLSTPWKTIKCRDYHGPSSQFGFAKTRGLRLITNSTSRFNDRIYNDNAKYAIIYIADKAQQTALIDVGGIIDWHYTPNALRPADMQSAATVKAAIVACGLSTIISPFVVEDLKTLDRH